MRCSACCCCCCCSRELVWRAGEIQLIFTGAGITKDLPAKTNTIHVYLHIGVEILPCITPQPPRSKKRRKKILGLGFSSSSATSIFLVTLNLLPNTTAARKKQERERDSERVVRVTCLSVLHNRPRPSCPPPLPPSFFLCVLPAVASTSSHFSTRCSPQLLHHSNIMTQQLRLLPLQLLVLLLLVSLPSVFATHQLKAVRPDSFAKAWGGDHTIYSEPVR